MYNRRKFLQNSGALLLGSIALSESVKALFRKKGTWPIGLQLYTLGDLMTTDAKGTLQKLAAIGYKELESAGSQKGNYYGFTPKEFAAMVKDLGMTWRSAHVGGAPFTIDRVMKMAKTAADSARIQKMMEKFKNAPKSLNLTENYQELADKAAEG